MQIRKTNSFLLSVLWICVLWQLRILQWRSPFRGNLLICSNPLKVEALWSIDILPSTVHINNTVVQIWIPEASTPCITACRSYFPRNLLCSSFLNKTKFLSVLLTKKSVVSRTWEHGLDSRSKLLFFVLHEIHWCYPADRNPRVEIPPNICWFPYLFLSVHLPLNVHCTYTEHVGGNIRRFSVYSFGRDVILTLYVVLLSTSTQ